MSGTAVRFQIAGKRPWLIWLGALVVVTGALRAVRGNMEQAHVTLIYLLLVLGASASGGRRIGLTVATVAIAAIDFFFQAPYDTILVHHQLDWLVLATFYLTALVATNLLARAKREAETATQLTIEARQLAQLGARTLRHGSPAAALQAIAALVVDRFNAGRCVIRGWREDAGLDATTYQAIPRTGRAFLIDPGALTRCAANGVGLVIDAAGRTTECGPSDLESLPNAAFEGARTIVLPLELEQRTVGVLALTDDAPLRLGNAERRFLTALAYYAAVALEWERLSTLSAHASAAAEASRMKELVLVSASHDLRTPLTTIKALAQSGPLAGSSNGRAIEEQVDRLTRLVEDVLEFSRLERADLPLEIGVNMAEDLVGAVVRQTRGIVGSGRLDVRLTLEPAALAGRFDFVGSLRILTNLIENAARFTPAGEVVTLSVEGNGDWLEFAVADRGPGVPVSEREAIFEPFYRPRSHPVDAGRVGLGLAIARRLAMAQQGTLELTSREGGGSVFTLRLPRAEVPEEVPAPSPEQAPSVA